MGVSTKASTKSDTGKGYAAVHPTQALRDLRESPLTQHRAPAEKRSRSFSDPRQNRQNRQAAKKMELSRYAKSVKEVTPLPHFLAQLVAQYAGKPKCRNCRQVRTLLSRKTILFFCSWWCESK